jgi:hypothetical protein
MVLKRVQGACCLSNKFTSLFSTFLLFSTSLTPVTFVFSTAAHADDVHAVCVTPNSGETFEYLQGLHTNDPATILNLNDFTGNQGFKKVDNPHGPPTFQIDASILKYASSASTLPAQFRDATPGDIKATQGVLLDPQNPRLTTSGSATSAGNANSGSVNSGLTGGAIGLPVLSTVEATNTEVQDLIRQRRELAAAATTTVAAATVVPAETTNAPPPPAAASKPAASNSNMKTYDASAPQTGIAMDYDYDSLPSNGAWAQAFADYERHDGLAPGSGENLVRKQTTVGGISGADTTYRRFTEDGLETFQFGLLGGGTHITSNFSDFGNVTNARQTQDGGFVGAYGTYRHDNFSIDGFFKADLLTLRQRSTVSEPVKCDPGQVLVIDNTPNALESTTQQSGKVDEYTYTVGSNAYYRFDLDNGAYFEPLIGFIFGATNYGNGATALGLDNGQLFRLQGGARLGKSWDDDQNRTWSVALLGLLYSDLYVNGYTLDGFGLPPGASEVDEGKLRVLGQLEGSVNLNNGLSFNGTVGVRGGQDVVGVGGRLGARFEW